MAILELAGVAKAWPVSGLSDRGHHREASCHCSDFAITPTLMLGQQRPAAARAQS